MSETDWATAGCPVGKPNRALFTAIDKVEALLQPYGGPLWPQLIKTALMLIVVARTAAGNVMLIAKSRKPSRCARCAIIRWLRSRTCAGARN